MQTNTDGAPCVSLRRDNQTAAVNLQRGSYSPMTGLAQSLESEAREAAREPVAVREYPLHLDPIRPYERGVGRALQQHVQRARHLPLGARAAGERG